MWQGGSGGGGGGGLWGQGVGWWGDRTDGGGGRGVSGIRGKVGWEMERGGGGGGGLEGGGWREGVEGGGGGVVGSRCGASAQWLGGSELTPPRSATPLPLKVALCCVGGAGTGQVPRGAEAQRRLGGGAGSAAPVVDVAVTAGGRLVAGSASAMAADAGAVPAAGVAGVRAGAWAGAWAGAGDMVALARAEVPAHFLPLRRTEPGSAWSDTAFTTARSWPLVTRRSSGQAALVLNRRLLPGLSELLSGTPRGWGGDPDPGPDPAVPVCVPPAPPAAVAVVTAPPPSATVP